MESKSITNWKSGTNYFQLQILGNREEQEDFSEFQLINHQDLLAVLSDGMGGHTAGEIASQTAVREFIDGFTNTDADNVRNNLHISLNLANAKISELISEDPNLNGMGCTLVGAYFNKDGVRWISVGDSVLYLFRNGALVRLNQDHSMAGFLKEAIELGKISRSEAEKYGNSNALRSAVTGEDIALIDLPDAVFKIYSGDIFVIASDGLLTLDERQIFKRLDDSKINKSAEMIAKVLIEDVVSKKKLNQDNTTIQVIRIPDAFPAFDTKKQPSNILLLVFLMIFFAMLAAYYLFK